MKYRIPPFKRPRRLQNCEAECCRLWLNASFNYKNGLFLIVSLPIVILYVQFAFLRCIFLPVCDNASKLAAIIVFIVRDSGISDYFRLRFGCLLNNQMTITWYYNALFKHLWHCRSVIRILNVINHIRITYTVYSYF